jgi:hypothetical protein
MDVKKRKREPDVNQLAQMIVQRSTAEPISISKGKKRKNPAAVALGRAGGLKSAKGRMEKITPERRREIASKAARERWAKEKHD